MEQRSSKLASLNAVDPWTLGEIGTRRGKKIYKSLIKRQRRTLEKRQARNEIASY